MESGQDPIRLEPIVRSSEASALRYDSEEGTGRANSEAVPAYDSQDCMGHFFPTHGQVWNS